MGLENDFFLIEERGFNHSIGFKLRNYVFLIKNDSLNKQEYDFFKSLIKTHISPYNINLLVSEGKSDVALISVKAIPRDIKKIFLRLKENSLNDKILFYSPNIISRDNKQKESKILKSTDPNLLKKIYENFIDNKEIIIDEIYSLIDNKDFIDLIMDNKIEFSSEKNKDFTNSISGMFKYLSERFENDKGGNKELGKKNQINADNFSLKIGPVLEELENSGFNSIRKKAEELNKRNIKSFRGKLWTHHNVHATQKRYEALKLEEEKNKTTSSVNSPKPQ